MINFILFKKLKNLFQKKTSVKSEYFINIVIGALFTTNTIICIL